MKRIFLFFIVSTFLSLPLFSQPGGNGSGRILNAAELREAGWFYSLDSALANPDRVYKLSLSGQKMKTLPAEIGTLTNLQMLSLSECGLKSLPDELAKCKKLQMISLYHNKLKFLPPYMREFSKLEVLYLGQNRLTEIPIWVGGMGRLRRLDVSRNPITPSELNYIRNMIPKADVTY